MVSQKTLLYKIDTVAKPRKPLDVNLPCKISNGYTMGCPPILGDNPRDLASGLSNVQVDNPWCNYLIPPTSV